MKLINVFEKTPIKLMPIGDLHVGSKEFDKTKYESTIKWIKSNKDVRVVLMGDLIDAGLKDSVGGGSFDNDLEPNDQIEYIINSLTPIKDKIWCTIIGNHEERIRERTSLDVMKYIADKLETKYGDSSCFIKANIGGINYTIYMTHGSSSSGSAAGKLAAIEKLGQFIYADLILMGHVHELMSHTSTYFRIDIGNKMIVQDKRHFVITGHFVNYGGYVQKKNLFPGKTGVAKIEFSTDKKQIRLVL